jgi:DNA-binding MarR family transcriptional regulator
LSKSIQGHRGEQSPRVLAGRLNTVVLHLGRQLRRADEALGLPTAQASALTLLVSAGRHTITDLAGFERVSAPTMTRIVTALERRGFVTRTRSPGDLRVVHVEATAEGRALISRALSNRLERLEGHIAGLSGKERATLSDALDLLSQMAEHSAGFPADRRADTR